LLPPFFGLSPYIFYFTVYKAVNAAILSTYIALRISIVSLNIYPVQTPVYEVESFRLFK